MRESVPDTSPHRYRVADSTVGRKLTEALPEAIDSDDPTLLDVQVDPFAVPPILV
jgi:thiamine pyrophosphate-dependent acetolactate synthase large subunit-like protein